MAEQPARGNPTRQLVVFTLVVLVGCAAILAGTNLSHDHGTTNGSTPVQDGGIDVAGHTGGQIIASAPGWPTCLNPVLARCAASPWLDWTVAEQVLPKLMELDADGNYVASPLLERAPSVANGDLSLDPPQVTFRLSSHARWSNGTPISATDVNFTWQAITSTPGSIDGAPYDAIESIDFSNPRVVTISLRHQIGDWQELFGGEHGYVLEAGQFASNDTSDQMLDGVGFSGGPWLLERWTPSEAVLRPNARYWDQDRVPRVDQLVIRHRTGLGSDPAKLLAGNVDVAFVPDGKVVPTPDPQIDVSVDPSPTYEGIWFDQRGLLADPSVRRALQDSIDRRSLLTTVVAPDYPEVKLLECVGWVPTIDDWCQGTEFARAAGGPAVARRTLLDAGYTLGPDGIFRSPDGQRLSLTWTTVAGDKEQADVRNLATVQAHAAGIQILPEETTRRDLLDTRLPHRTFEIAEFSLTARADPSVTALLGCSSIPSAVDGYTGGNVFGWCDRRASALMQRADAALDPTQRLDLTRQVGERVAAAVIGLPLYQRPSVVTWRTDQVGGPVDEFLTSPLGPFWNAWAWTRTTAPAASTTTSSG